MLGQHLRQQRQQTAWGNEPWWEHHQPQQQQQQQLYRYVRSIIGVTHTTNGSQLFSPQEALVHQERTYYWLCRYIYCCTLLYCCTRKYRRHDTRYMIDSLQICIIHIRVQYTRGISYVHNLHALRPSSASFTPALQKKRKKRIPLHHQLFLLKKRGYICRQHPVVQNSQPIAKSLRNRPVGGSNDLSRGTWPLRSSAACSSLESRV